MCRSSSANSPHSTIYYRALKLRSQIIKTINQENIIKKLNENEVYKNWRAIAPVNFYHGGSDSIIPFILSKIACRRMKANGAKAELINAGAPADRADSIIPSCLMARDWFASL